MAATRNDPFFSFRFKLEIDGLIAGGFSEVSGLQVETETEDYREGGLNDYVHKIVKVTKFPNLILKRGITDSDLLWKWHQSIVLGKIQRRSGRIILLDSTGQEKWHWVFNDAFPVKWSGPDFKGDSNTIAIETLDLVHRGINKG